MKIKNKPTQKFRNKQKRRTKKIGGFKFFPSRGRKKTIPYTNSMEKKAAKEQDIKKQASEYKKWWNTLESEYAIMEGKDINKSDSDKTYYEMIQEVEKDGTMKTKLQKIKNDSIEDNEFYYRPYCTDILKELIVSSEAQEEANKIRNPFNKENKKDYEENERVIISNNGEHGQIVEKLPEHIHNRNKKIETQHNNKNCKKDCYLVNVNDNEEVYKNIELKPDTCKTPNFLSITPSKYKPRTPSRPKKRSPNSQKRSSSRRTPNSQKRLSSRRNSSTKK